MAKLRYNVWIDIEQVVLDENDNQVHWQDELFLPVSVASEVEWYTAKGTILHAISALCPPWDSQIEEVEKWTEPEYKEEE